MNAEGHIQEPPPRRLADDGAARRLQGRALVDRILQPRHREEQQQEYPRPGNAVDHHTGPMFRGRRADETDTGEHDAGDFLRQGDFPELQQDEKNDQPCRDRHQLGQVYKCVNESQPGNNQVHPGRYPDALLRQCVIQ